MPHKTWAHMTAREKWAVAEGSFAHSKRMSECDVAERERRDPLAPLRRRRASYEDADDYGPTWAGWSYEEGDGCT